MLSSSKNNDDCMCKYKSHPFVTRELMIIRTKTNTTRITTLPPSKHEPKEEKFLYLQL
jgi:hypothetical protein